MSPRIALLGPQGQVGWELQRSLAPWGRSMLWAALRAET